MTHFAEIERTAAAWLARRESGWSDAEHAQFLSWLQASTAHRVAWIRLETGWRRAARLKALGAGMPSGEVPRPGAWPELPGAEAEPAVSAAASVQPAHGLRSQASRRPRVRRWPYWTVAAAAVLLLAVGLGGWWQYGGVQRAEYATAVGETQRVALNDGSVALLSSDTRLAVTYTRRQRSLQLVQGEAFFEVASNPARPFAVHAGQRRVVAVGTRFSVRRDAADLRVAVSEGRVRLEDEAQAGIAAPTMLIAGMVAVADGEGVRLHQRAASEVEDLLRWREGMLVFRSTPLSQAVAEFNRYNTHKLVVDDPSIAGIPVGGSFRWRNTEAFVRVLEQGFGLRAERRDGETHLHAQ